MAAITGIVTVSLNVSFRRPTALDRRVVLAQTAWRAMRWGGSIVLQFWRVWGGSPTEMLKTIVEFILVGDGVPVILTLDVAVSSQNVDGRHTKFTSSSVSHKSSPA